MGPNMGSSDLFTKQSVTSPLIKKDKKLQKRKYQNDQDQQNQKANAV